MHAPTICYLHDKINMLTERVTLQLMAAIGEQLGDCDLAGVMLARRKRVRVAKEVVVVVVFRPTLAL